MLAKVDFLESLGLPSADAATAAGSTKASVDELKRLRNKKAGKNGKGKKKKRGR